MLYKDGSWHTADASVFTGGNWHTANSFVFSNDLWVNTDRPITINTSTLTIDFFNAQSTSFNTGIAHSVTTFSLPQDPGDLRYFGYSSIVDLLFGINNSNVYAWFPTSSSNLTLQNPAILDNVDTSNLDHRVNYIFYTHYGLEKISEDPIFVIDWTDYTALNGTDNLGLLHYNYVLQQKSSDLFLIFVITNQQTFQYQVINQLDNNVKTLNNCNIHYTLIQHIDGSLYLSKFDGSDLLYIKLDGLPLNIDFDNIFINDDGIMTFNYNNRLYLVDSSNGEIKYLDNFKQFNAPYIVKNLTNSDYYFIDYINITSLSIKLDPINIPDQNYLTTYGESDNLVYQIVPT